MLRSPPAPAGRCPPQDPDRQLRHGDVVGMLARIPTDRRLPVALAGRRYLRLGFDVPRVARAAGADQRAVAGAPERARPAEASPRFLGVAWGEPAGLDGSGPDGRRLTQRQCWTSKR